MDAAEALESEAGAALPRLLEARGIDKQFPGVRALKSVDLLVGRGEIVGLVGENGAGKSTLAKVIAGVHPPDEGTLAFDGEERTFSSTRQAEAVGIVMIPQELQVAPRMSIAENMFMGALPTRGGVVDRGLLFDGTKEQLSFFELRAEPFAPLSTLATSEQRLVTIAAALRKSAKLLVLDEPTAALTDKEADRLFAHMHLLRDRGISFLHVSHRLDEMEAVVDRVVVMRDGEVVTRFASSKGQRRAIVRAMIGRDPEDIPKRGGSEPGEVVLQVSDLTVRDAINPARVRVDKVSFSVRRGEVVAFFGLIGAGRTEIARAIFGSWPGEISGEMSIKGKEWNGGSPRDAISHGIALLTEDRKQTGIIAGQSVSANMSAAEVKSVSRGLFIREDRERRRNAELVRRLDVRPPRLDVNIETLSGGNQQKVLLGRWLNTDPDLLILDEPTLGLDVGARFEVFTLIRQLAKAGRAVMLISSDMEEVLAEADRIIVMYKGRLADEFPAGAPRDELMAAATGGESR
ncbi:MAG: sugar ABC transporter ATP-binding protein [Solirubrobacterales bacterium]|nr:sugar ABC transporter ATP-binding protein [Solirubrobacterales bacterium]